MSFQVERREIEKRFQSVFGIANPAIPIAWENRVFKRPDANTTWVAFSILRGAESMQLDIAPNTPWCRRFGIVHINVYAPEQKGADLGMILADKVGSVFNNLTLLASDNSVICFQVSTLRNVGNRDGKWQAVVQTSFYHDTVDGAAVPQDMSKSVFYIPSGAMNGVNVTFTLTVAPVASQMQLFFNGELMDPTSDYSVAGTTITLTFAPKAGDKLVAYY